MSRQNNFPSSWMEVSLGQIADFVMGQAPPGDACNHEERGTLFVKAGEFGVNRPIEREWTTMPLKFGRHEDVFICVVGATCGKLNLGADCAIGRSVAAIRPRTILDQHYLYYQLQTQVMGLRSTSAGSAQGVLNRKQLSDIAIRIAPINEQRRIVAKIEELFSDLDAGVAVLKRAKANLKRYRAAVLKAAVEGKLTEEWRAKHPAQEPASALLARILKERRQKWEADQLAKFAAAGKEPPKNWRDKYDEPSPPVISGLPGLPAGWCWCTASQICEIVASGSTPAADQMKEDHGDIPFLKVYNLTFTGILDFSIKPTFIDLETHLKQGRSIVLPGDVLINIVGPPLGKVSIVPDDYREWNINQAIVVFRPTSCTLNKYLAMALMTDSVMKRVTSLAKATAGQSNIGVSMCRDLLPLPLAPLVEQQQIVSHVSERLSQIDAAETQVEHGLLRAARLRQSILKQAFEGKLVPQDPKDEPAGVLLERLRAKQSVQEGKGKPSHPTRSHGGRKVKSNQLEGRADE
jgi:type I restriction enzyme S subunit